MKMTFMSYAAMLLLAASLFSCKKETVTPPNETNNSPASMLTVAKVPIENPGMVSPAAVPFWTVGSFIINGKNVAQDYNGIRFEFSDENLVTATLGEVSVSGKWYMKDARHLFLSFSYFGLLPLSDLNENWIITRTTAQCMYLRSDDLLFPKDLRLDMNLK